MALKGTLKDFGIADILQLIGQQQKSGNLMLTSKGEAVTVSFKDGNIVRAESASPNRTRRNLIGSMLVNASLVSEAQLDFALETQKRTLQRLGDVLVGQGVITVEKFRDMVGLQTSETLYRLFQWNNGTYEFEQTDVEVDQSLVPLRAETVLMEGFRRVDEWPVVRKRIVSLRMTFERLKELPPPQPKRAAFENAALDDAFAEEKREGPKGGEFQSVGQNERLCFSLVAGGRTVQRIVELSCLGEFETAKALCNLVNLEFLRGVPPTGRGGDDFESDSRVAAFLGMAGRIAVTMLVVGAVLFIGSQLDVGAMRFGGSGATSYSDPAAQRFAGRQQLARLTAALEVYRLETGTLPVALAELVESGLLVADDLRYPWRDDYYYRRANDGGYVLLPPLR
jgi:hypothetical protein